MSKHRLLSNTQEYWFLSKLGNFSTCTYRGSIDDIFNRRATFLLLDNRVDTSATHTNSVLLLDFVKSSILWTYYRI